MVLKPRIDIVDGELIAVKKYKGKMEKVQSAYLLQKFE